MLNYTNNNIVYSTSQFEHIKIIPIGFQLFQTQKLQIVKSHDITNNLLTPYVIK
jgi:hypothetical protein